MREHAPRHGSTEAKHAAQPLPARTSSRAIALQRSVGNRAARLLLARDYTYVTLPSEPAAAAPAGPAGPAAPAEKAPYSYVVQADPPAQRAPYSYVSQMDAPASAAPGPAAPPGGLNPVYEVYGGGAVPDAGPAAVAKPSHRLPGKKQVFDKSEQESSFAFMQGLISNPGALLHDLIRNKLLPAGSKVKDIKPAIFRLGVKRLWGWTDADLARYYELLRDPEVQADPAKAGARWKVDYIKDAARRESFVIRPGETWTTPDGQPFDTRAMTSKASGPGFAIFVMDRDGVLYAGGHKVGLFHHSSFLGGKKAAAAGEIRVEGGRLKEVTAKSGHYMPTPENTRVFVEELARAGANLRGVKVKVWKAKPGGRGMDTWIYDAEEFRQKGEAARGHNTGKPY